MTPTDLADLRARCAEPLPHPTPDELRHSAEQVLAHALDDFQQLPSRPLGRGAPRDEMEARLRQPLPEEGQPFAEALEDFRRLVAPFAYRPQHPRFLAFIPSAPCYPALLGDWLCASSNYFAGVWLEAAGPAQVELVVLDWFRDLLGLPAGTAGLLTGGGSEANLTALVVARDRLPPAERAQAALYASSQRHWSIGRAAHVAGLMPEQLRAVEADAEGRLGPRALAQAIRTDRAAGRRPWAVVANAGTTNTGAIDPLPALAELCAREGLWLHVDAAYGGAAALSVEGRRLLAGIERADSVTLDPHKWMAQPFEVGCLLVRRGELLNESFAMRPEYMQDVEPEAGAVNFADRGLALTRRFRALKVWLSFRALGAGWFRRLVDHGIALARYAEAALRAAGFEVLCPARLSIVCFRLRPAGELAEERINQLNRRLIDAVRASGEAFLSSTRLGPRVALRFCFINWRTTAADVDHILALLRRLAAE